MTTHNQTTRPVLVGGVTLGGGAGIKIQSMTTTKTSDVEKTVAQIGALEENLETAMNQNITEVNNQLDVLLAQLETVESRIYNLASQTLKYHYDAASNTLYLMPYEE